VARFVSILFRDHDESALGEDRHAMPKQMLRRRLDEEGCGWQKVQIALP
jgi:hypothetical protein